MSTHRSVLLIDDDPDLREMVSIALGSEGFTIHQAENGKQGLEMLADCEPDIILLDMMMPEMNGIEFCRALTDGVDEVDVPVLVMSAVNEKAKTLRDFQEMNITTKGFLHKPFDLRELISRVKAMIGDVPPASEKPAESPPAKPAEPVESARARLSPTVANGPRVRILLVDDDPDILDAMQITLGTQFDVRTAPNGAEALSQIESFDPDFIISDIEMPVLDGLKMVERLRRDPRFGGLPVFFLSGMEGTNLPRKTFNVGGNLFLRKPMEPQRLLKIIEHFIAETGIKPRPAGVERRAAAAQPVTRQPAPSPAAPKRPVRVLTVESNPELEKIMQRLLKNAPKDSCETLWAEDARAAMSNIPKWEPDVIFYDPRNRGLDGIAFVQSLKIKKLAANCDIAFIGKEFFKAEIEFSRQALGRNVIKLDLHEAMVAEQINEVLSQSRSRMKDKHHDLSEIEAEQKQQLAQAQAQRHQIARQREYFRERFGNIQQFIDDQLKKP